MTAPALPGSLRDLLAVGMVVHADAPFLHAEHDPEFWRPTGGLVHTHNADFVGTIAVGVKGSQDGLVLGSFPIDRIHDCDDELCLYRPHVAFPSDVRYHARWLLRAVGRGKGRLTDYDRRLIAAAVSLLTKAIV